MIKFYNENEHWEAMFTIKQPFMWLVALFWLQVTIACMKCFSKRTFFKAGTEALEKLSRLWRRECDIKTQTSEIKYCSAHWHGWASSPNRFFDLQLILVLGQNRQCNCSEEIDRRWRGNLSRFFEAMEVSKVRRCSCFSGFPAEKPLKFREWLMVPLILLDFLHFKELWRRAVLLITGTYC